MPATTNLGLEPRQRIELDAPLSPRLPGDLIAGVIRGLLPRREPRYIWVGCWCWCYEDLPAETWERVRPVLQERICGLLDADLIRWGSW